MSHNNMAGFTAICEAIAEGFLAKDGLLVTLETEIGPCVVESKPTGTGSVATTIRIGNMMHSSTRIPHVVYPLGKAKVCLRTTLGADGLAALLRHLSHCGLKAQENELAAIQTAAEPSPQ